LGRERTCPGPRPGVLASSRIRDQQAQSGVKGLAAFRCVNPVAIAQRCEHQRTAWLRHHRRIADRHDSERGVRPHDIGAIVLHLRSSSRTLKLVILSLCQAGCTTCVISGNLFILAQTAGDGFFMPAGSQWRGLA
jgi:hypothetical protein